MSGPSFDEVREVVEKLPCPVCKAEDSMALVREMYAKPLGEFSLAGAQMKFSAHEIWTAACSACRAAFRVGDAEYDD